MSSPSGGRGEGTVVYASRFFPLSEAFTFKVAAIDFTFSIISRLS